MRIMDDPIKDCDSKFFIKQEIFPMAEFYVGGNDDTLLLIAFTDHFK